MNSLRLPMLLAGLGLAASPALAQLIVYDFTGNVGSEAAEPAASLAPGVTAGDLTRGPGLGAEDGSGSFIDNDFSFGLGGGAPADLAAAVAGDRYLTFSASFATPVNITALSGSIWDQNAAAITMQFQADLGGGFFDVGAPVVFNDPGASWATLAYSVDTTGVASLQGITGPAVIRAYIYGNNAWEQHGLRQNLTVEGSAVPESASAAALAAALALAATAARRVRRHA